MVAPALIYAGLMLASAVGNGISASEQEKAYEDYQNKVRAAAMENYRYQTKAIANRTAEEAEASKLQQQQIVIKNMQSKATAKASAAGSGVTGSTIDNLFKDYDRATAASNYIASRNLYLKKLQSYDEQEAAYIQAMNQINTMGQYSGANLWSTLLGGGGSAMSAYSSAKLTDMQTKYYSSNGRIAT